MHFTLQKQMTQTDPQAVAEEIAHILSFSAGSHPVLISEQMFHHCLLFSESTVNLQCLKWIEEYAKRKKR
jgi:hypothetical protein